MACQSHCSSLGRFALRWLSRSFPLIILLLVMVSTVQSARPAHGDQGLLEAGNPSLTQYSLTPYEAEVQTGLSEPASRPQSRWVVTTIASAGDVGRYCSLALDSSGNPGISYYDATNGRLKYAKWTGDRWYIDDLAAGGIGQWSSLAFDRSNYPHISSYDSKDMELTYYTPGVFEEVDSSGDYAGKYSSLALSSSGRPHIAYLQRTRVDRSSAPPYYNFEIRLATRWGRYAWSRETVTRESTEGAASGLIFEFFFISFSNRWFSVDSQGQPHLVYGFPELWYARKGSTGWSYSKFDNCPPKPSPSLALNAQDQPRIVYQCNGLRYASWNGSHWITQTLAFTGTNPSLALDRLGEC